VVSVLHEIGMALHADDIVVMDQGQVIHHGPSHEADTRAAIEAVFDHRISIHALDGQWVVLPRTA
jgi:iron complex transport system ATP-binding protein